ncbi:MAG: shikimate dehydrogenase family protein [Candidatus Binatia bacterium]
MATPNEIARIQSCINNTLDRDVIGKNQIAGVIGDSPSHYSKSPSLWNAAFRALNMKAVYLPFDVTDSRLPELVHALRESDRVMGCSVTVPYKARIMEYLDGLDKKAEQIKAVNTVVRTKDGRLIGYNTDGKGLLESILTPPPGQARPLVQALKGTKALLIGAGGAARSVAFYLAEILGSGQLQICNRTPEIADSLAEEINKVFGNASAIKEEEIHKEAPKVGLIVNCSIKGQGGIRKISDEKITILEPYSALAPANPAFIPATENDRPEFYHDWLSASLSDIEANNRASWNLVLSIPPETGFCDLIYHPEETIFLRHGRLSGHRTLNGKGMLIAQAADGFFDKICRAYLQKLGIHNPNTYKSLFELMHKAW